jgi:hypothetical protein
MDRLWRDMTTPGICDRFWIGFIVAVAVLFAVVAAWPTAPTCPPAYSPLAASTPGSLMTPCHCTYLPVVAIEVTPAPPPTITPSPTVTPTATPIWPDLDAYTQTTVLIWPRNKSVGVGEPFTERVILVDRDDVYAFEMAITVSPAVVVPITVTLAASTTCELFDVRLYPATIRVECEGLRLGPSGAMLDLAMSCAAPGVSLIDSAGVWGTFAGTGSGWGFWPQVGAAWVTCER